MTRLAFAGLAAAAAMAAFPVGAGAASIPVTTTADQLNGSAPCSLREALRSASVDAPVGGCVAGEIGALDTVALGPGTHTLSTPGAPEDAGVTGDIDFATGAAGIEITGTSAAATTIDAGGLDRALDVSGAGALRLEGIGIVNGAAPGPPSEEGGGGVRWATGAGSLTVADSLFERNAGLVSGGAIEATSPATVTVERSSFTGNLSGGGTIRATGALEIEDSTIEANVGGGVLADGPLVMTGSTVAGHDNTDTRVGGVLARADALIERSTIVDNAGGFSGGIEAQGALTVRFSTVANNRSPAVTTSPAAGIEASAATSVTLDGTIVSGNRFRVGPGPAGDCNIDAIEGPSPNLDSDGSCGLTAPGSISGADAQVAPLASNGGPTPTAGLYPDSPALDAAGLSCLPVTDQRGITRPVGAACDIGAFEGTVPRPPPAATTVQPVPATPAAPAAKKCGKKQRLAKNGKCVKKKKKKKKKGSKARAFAAEVHERVVVGKSVRGRSIVASRVGDPDGARVALAVGVIHGDERAGLGVLEQISSTDLDGVQLWVIPTINPDGQRGRQRRNARGVDLNRNFPFRWRGGVPPSSGYYPGRGPASEPETKAVMAFIERVRPQVSVWYHQPWGAVLACRGAPEAAARYAALAGMRTSCRGKGLRGTAISWQREAISGSQAFVVEFGPGGVSQGFARRHATALATIARDDG